LPYERALAAFVCAHCVPKVISERLGHASIGITLDTYSHAFPALQEDAAEQIAAMVFDWIERTSVISSLSVAHP
jgi:integrase